MDTNELLHEVKELFYEVTAKMSTRQIKYGAIISYFSIGFNIIAGLIYTPWMVKQIGVSDFGLYTLVTAFLTYFLIDFGLGSSIARFIAKYRAEGKAEKIESLLGITIRIYLYIDTIIIITLFILYFFLSDIFKELNTQEIEKFKIIYCIAGFFSVVSFPLMPVQGAMIAYEKFIIDKIADLAQKALVIISMVVALLLGYGLFALVLVNGFIGFGIKIYKFFFLKRNELIKINLKNFDKPLVKELLQMSVIIFIIAIADRFLMTLPPTILGIFSGTQEIAVFGIARTLEGYTWTIAMALNGLFLPKLTRMITEKYDGWEITSLMINVGRFQILIIGMIITGIIVLGKSFILLWMGPAFKHSYFVSLLIIVPMIITSTQEIASTLILVVNKLKYKAILFITASVISVIIGCILAPSLGAIGTAMGICTALLLSHIIGMNIVYSRVLKLDITGFFKSVHLKMLWPMAVAGILSVLIQKYYPIYSWKTFIVSGTFFVIVYSGLMWIFVMNSLEKELVKGLLRKILPVK